MAETRFSVDKQKLEVSTHRVFEAPRDLVFKALTDPDLLPRWWGPARYAVTIEQFEPKPGGVWRFITRGEDGSEDGFRGEFREVSPERIVQTFEWDGMPGHVALDTMTLQTEDAKTIAHSSTIWASEEDLEGALPGMEEGAIETWDRLANLLRELQQHTEAA